VIVVVVVVVVVVIVVVVVVVVVVACLALNSHTQKQSVQANVRQVITGAVRKLSANHVFHLQSAGGDITTKQKSFKIQRSCQG
jgi:type II secretory pathway pseudopilin PulG